MDGTTSTAVDLSQYNLRGFCKGYELRRHKYEDLTNSGCQDARNDWTRYIGPISQFGGCNPINGNFTAVVLPLCKPERLHTVAYILEYAFLYDNVVEQKSNTVNPSLYKSSQDEGRKRLQAKMMSKLIATDEQCAQRVKRVWKEMINTTLRCKDNYFHALEEYVDFRIIDTGAPFVEAMMLWGMSMILTPEEDELLAPIVYPCFAALGLANDYFSFDRELREMQENQADNLINAVWLHMRWHGVDATSAKDMVRQATIGYEQEFLHRCEAFRKSETPISEKLDCYLRGLSYQISGNVVWSLNCPRYHPAYRYEQGADVTRPVDLNDVSRRAPEYIQV